MSITPNASESWSCKVGRGFTRMSFTHDQFGGIYATPGDTMQEQNTQPQITEVGMYDAKKAADALNNVYKQFHSIKQVAEGDESGRTISDKDADFLVAIGACQFYAASVAELRKDLNAGEKLIVVTLLQMNPPSRAALEGKSIPEFTEADIVNHAKTLTQAIDVHALESLKQETAARGLASAEAAGVADLQLETPEVLAGEVEDKNAGAKAAAKILSEAKGEAPKTAVINGVEVMALKDVETPDGVKPFADGNIVGVFDQSEKQKSIEERLGQPDEFITKALRKAGVKDPEAWKGGMMTVWTDPKVDIKQRIFHINQQLRLYIAEVAVDHSSTIQPRATIVDGVSVEDWYKIISAGILKYMADLMIEHQERVAKAAATATA